ncbi:ABC transporter permease subunit [Paenibacillus roseipurpureus]|uniref:ABC transporter permease subunit n=1 Tax=Paenibacillus roseopurpureus TaxID=2918901 RepID=A0AA96LR52_9BACL|nr:ABC transporter permease subunit [Paenibacillus sp. MBLB1832]WNR44544.1 ABC transporter permease subunit [Paenibacillus sp. MBLB1832]
MFSKTYLMRLVKSNLKMSLIFMLLLCGLIAIIMNVFTPETMSEIAGRSADMPINPLGDISTLPKFLANQYFGMMALIFPMIFLILTGTKLIVGKVDKGDMACDLSTPVTRTQIAFTSMLYLVGSLAVIYVMIGAVGSSVASIAQPGELDYAMFLTMVFGSFLLQLAIGSIVFLASCVFNRTSRSLIIGAGLPILFFGAHLLSGMSDKLEGLKYLSLVTLFDTTAIINGSGYAAKLGMLGILAVVLYTAGIMIFKQKDLPL